MTLLRMRAPLAEPVTVAQVKAQLRLDHNGDDAIIADFIKAARETVEREAGVALIDQGFRLTIDAVPENGIVNVPVHPVTAVTAVAVYDAAGQATLVPLSAITLDGYGQPPRIVFANPPNAGRALNGVALDFDAGFGATAVDVPPMLVRAVTLLAAHFYEFRASVRAEDAPLNRPVCYAALIAPWKRVRL